MPAITIAMNLDKNLMGAFMGRSMVLVAIILMSFVGSCSASEIVIRNPIRNLGADPWVVLHEGRYYYCCSMGNGIGISVSDEPYIINEPQKVWTAKPHSWNSHCIWAPELHFWSGKWYVFYAAGQSGPPYIHQRTGVLESVTDDPLGEYVDKGLLFTGEDDENIWAIDFTLFDHDGQLYGVWSGWEKNRDTDVTPQHLYIARMSNPWTISSGRVKISSPDADYEVIGDLLPINEGPQVLQHGGNVFVVYSCGQSWLPTYKLSMLTLKSDADDLLDPDSWHKSDKPVFEGTEKVFGVGHASFTTSKDGCKHYIIYHTKRTAESGWDRMINIQQFSFDSKGEPVFGTPIPAGEDCPL